MTQNITPLVELVGEDEALGVSHREVLPLLLQEVPEVHSGEHTAVGRMLKENGVQFRPS